MSCAVGVAAPPQAAKYVGPAVPWQNFLVFAGCQSHTAVYYELRKPMAVSYLPGLQFHTEVWIERKNVVMLKVPLN